MDSFDLGDFVRKKGEKGQWHGKIVGTYSTDCTPNGYAVESVYELNSVQIYPEDALESWSGSVVKAGENVTLIQKISGYFHVESINSHSNIEWVKSNYIDSETGEPIYTCQLSRSQLVEAVEAVNLMYSILSGGDTK